MKIAQQIQRFLEVVGDVPFGNSDFQNRLAVINREGSPHRAYRHAALRIMDRLRALQEAYYRIKEQEIRKKRYERRIKLSQDDLEKEMLQLKIEKIEAQRPYEKKLIKDAIREIYSLLPVIQAMGKLDRELFEKMEKEHYRRRFAEQVAGKTEPLLGLEILQTDQDLYEKITGLDLEKQLDMAKGCIEERIMIEPGDLFKDLLNEKSN